MDNEVIILGEVNISPFLKATQSLSKALLEEKTDLVRDASIQRFEFTFELAWKTLRRILMHQGLRINNPRDVFRTAAEQKLIEDPECWFTFLNSRNNTTHTYNEDIANEIYDILPEFLKEVEKLISHIKTL